jgi:hypothetical protein
MFIKLFFCYSILLLSLATSTAKAVTVLVFHSNYYTEAYTTIESYTENLHTKGYQTVSVYSDTVSISTLKTKIQTALLYAKIDLKDVTGINIFGPVISTTLYRKLKNNLAPQLASSLLRYNNLNPVYDQNSLVDITADSPPYPVRWVSHQQFKDVNQFSEQLMNILAKIPVSGEPTRGEQQINKLRSEINSRRTIPLARWHDGPVWGVVAWVVIPSLWYIAGVDRESQGYNGGFNRFETSGDYIGNGFLYSSYFAGLSYSTYSIGRYLLNKAYQDSDFNWKKIALGNPLCEDGLLSIDYVSNEVDN